ncbi:hypothetical protein [Lacinutrix salivirga]
MLGKKLKIIAGVFALAIAISYFLIDANEKEFDINEWNANPQTRYKMSNAIIENKLLFGKTKTEVIQLLGPSETSTLNGKEYVSYNLGKTPSFFEQKMETLIITFDNEKVSSVINTYK